MSLDVRKELCIGLEPIFNKGEAYEELRIKHEKIRSILIDYGNEEYGDCIIDEICEVLDVLPTTTYYNDSYNKFLNKKIKPYAFFRNNFNRVRNWICCR